MWLETPHPPTSRLYYHLPPCHRRFAAPPTTGGFFSARSFFLGSFTYLLPFILIIPTQDHLPKPYTCIDKTTMLLRALTILNFMFISLALAAPYQRIQPDNPQQEREVIRVTQSSKTILDSLPDRQLDNIQNHGTTAKGPRGLPGV
ncbi:uncharacterized protein LAJ45_02868 [Morchella importuna]|uniref:uncharacterized protein n=1 Tax=Morchella importuna TaxID=1174673 RepID=UPI001E8D06C8|nr:uncharacterized protein LAJ45_02868 [Morchella importuna]KAH8153281.1 hypothetical protein LAJ45_02868 [Morchella importuna]